eukprot:INCI4150.1.p1 GENE.INCI4150.1~~INCI4150.1.p1  ORF type:complete len:430 (+),score=95.88 INCI4150.1:238-1527(+)
MSSAKGKVQLLRLQANKSRRDNLAKFDGRVSLALSTKYGVTPPTAAKTGDAGNSSSSSSSSNFDPPLFVVFDWVAFSRKVRQQYYEQLKTDFPGEFIYISASDDFVGLQGSISKSGCSVLYDVDTKTTARASRSEIFDQIRAASSAFFMQPNVRCCFFTQDFAAEREHLDLNFVHYVVDAAAASEGSTSTVAAPTMSEAAVASALAAHTKSELSLAFYTQGVLKALLCKPLTARAACTISKLAFESTVALEGPKVFVFLDRPSSAKKAAVAANYCCVLDAHVVNVWLALQFAEQVEAGEAAAAEAMARAVSEGNKEKASDVGQDEGLFLTGGGAEDETVHAGEHLDDQAREAAAVEAACVARLETSPWSARVPSLFFLSVDDETKDVNRAVNLHVRNADQLPPDAYIVRDAPECCVLSLAILQSVCVRG